MADYLPQGQPTVEARFSHQANVLQSRGLVLFAAGLVALGILALGIIGVMMTGFSHEEAGLEAMAPARFADDAGRFPAPSSSPIPTSRLSKRNGENSTSSMVMDGSIARRVSRTSRLTGRSKSWPSRACRSSKRRRRNPVDPRLPQVQRNRGRSHEEEHDRGAGEVVLKLGVHPRSIVRFFPPLAKGGAACPC